MKNFVTAFLFVAVIDLYGSDRCVYCLAAKQFFKKKGLEYNDKNTNITENKEFLEKKGLKSIPQIFINNKHIGGYSDMIELDNSGKLDEILKENVQPDK